MEIKQIILYHKIPTKQIFVDGEFIEILDAEIVPESKCKLSKENLIKMCNYVKSLNHNLFLEGKLKEKYFFKIERVN